MEKSFGLYFFIKKSKSSKAVEHFIYLHITVDCVGVTLVQRRNGTRPNGMLMLAGLKARQKR
jgi:hypothetical protein